MKKIISILTILFVAATARAQTAVTTVPANFTALDQVKIIVDVSGVASLNGADELYIWTWNPGDPSPGNGGWDNSNAARKMVKESTNKFSWTITPADYYAVAPGSITKIQFLAKRKNGNDGKTEDLSLNVAPLIYTPTDFRAFPSVAGQNELLTIYFDQNLATDQNTQRMTPTQAEVKLFNASGTQVGATKLYSLISQGSKLFSFYSFPKGDFVIPAGTFINKMTVVYKGTVLGPTGAPVNVSSVQYEKLFDDIK